MDMSRDEAASESSSNSRLSSPPASPPQTALDEIRVALRRQPDPDVPVGFYDGVVGVVALPPPATSVRNAATQNINTTLPAADAPPKQKRQRKAKEPNPGSKDEKPVKEKKTRKPREPKIKKELEAASTNTTAAPRKRLKTAGSTAPALADAPAGPRQSTITEMVNQYQPSAFPRPSPADLALHPQPSPTTSLPHPHLLPSTNRSQALLDAPGRASATPTPRPYSSGQNYDPIRGSTIDPTPRPSAIIANGASAAQASPHVNYASASPSIISLIDPPLTSSSPAQTPLPYSPQTVKQQPQHTQSLLSEPGQQHKSPALPKATPYPSVPLPPASLPADQTQKSSVIALDGAMDIDLPNGEVSTMLPPEVKVMSKASSSAPTPKAVPAKPISPPKATGSGLLSSSDLFGGPSSNAGAEREGVDIDIHISLNPMGGNTINMAQEIAKKYGRDAINPRAAVHRERLLQIAAAANRLDGGSADDMSVDLMSEADGDSNVEMGGVDDGQSATGGDETKTRKRKKKVEEYDKEDDFIDDTELAWQEKAAISKDGFFVYCGPLIPPGQNAQVESATSTRGKGGRGRRGTRAAAAATSNSTSHASVADKIKEANASSAGKTRARGGRGTGTTRKPRISKADRERQELEKQEREKMLAGGGAASAASGLPFSHPSSSAAAASTTAGTPNLPTTTSTALASNGLPLYQQQPPPRLAQPPTSHAYPHPPTTNGSTPSSYPMQGHPSVPA